MGGNVERVRTPLYFFSASKMAAERYKDEILEPYLRFFMSCGRSVRFFMDDNTRPHRGASVCNFLEGKGIRRMLWRARSPELNSKSHCMSAVSSKDPASGHDHELMAIVS
ncbi:hypothetical protein TNCV_883091 [Trichonephila clavipes]|nr:hypothetical protein TNCV_883091 [Trichonephila clavipes]